ncbi:MAG: TolC family protein [Armatimonadetes bacterium]|nr:TolC family protein [Armatimonadota bacterium]
MSVLALGFAAALLRFPQNDGFLTLDEALTIAEGNSFAIRTAESQVNEAEATRKLAQSAIGPGASITTTTSFSNFEGGGSFGPSGSSTTTSVQLGVQQVLDISGINKSKIRAAGFNIEAQRSGIDVAKNTLRGQVRAKFFAVSQAAEALEIQEATKTANEERLEKARIRLQEGAIPRFDVLRLETQVRQSEQAIIDAKGRLKNAKQDLNNTLGRAIETEFEVQTAPSLVELEQPVDELVQAALESRPEVEQVDWAIKSLTEARKAEEKAGRPSLRLQAAYTRNINPNFGQTDGQTSAQAVFTIPIVTGGAVAANARSAKEREERAKISQEQVLLGIALEVRTAMTEFQTAHENFVTAEQNVELAKEALRLAQLRYDEGVGILLDVTTSQADLTSAMNSRSIAAYRVRIAYAALQKAVGQDDLNNLQREEKPDEEQKSEDKN